MLRIALQAGGADYERLRELRRRVVAAIAVLE
jgi:hypothetical protein